MDKKQQHEARRSIQLDPGIIGFAMLAILALAICAIPIADILGWHKARQCLTNLGSIHWALSVYATDNDSRLPTSQTAYNAWESGVIAGWRLPAETFHCPSADGQSPSYGYRKGIPMVDLVVKPETFAYLMDSEGPLLWSVNENNGSCTVVSDSTRPWEYPTRHRGRMWVCFLDGNTKWLDQAELEAILDERSRLPSETYQTVTVETDGTVSVSNLTPGRYKLVPR